ncbi:MAG TPA: hypothetical protein VFM12_03150 [Gemmatimonadales bacterium]|nr:hypothetical protein [Gemmatimonadales bacterium]
MITVCRWDGSLHCRACASELTDPPLPGMFRIRRFMTGPALQTPCTECGEFLWTDDWAGYAPDHEIVCERCLYRIRKENQ